MTARLVFRFKDGSLSDETAVYSQRGRFRLLTDHVVQKGPSFSKPLGSFNHCRSTKRRPIAISASID